MPGKKKGDYGCGCGCGAGSKKMQTAVKAAFSTMKTPNAQKLRIQK